MPSSLDLDQAQLFLDTLGGPPHTFQTFHETKKMNDPEALRFARKRYGTLKQHRRELVDLNQGQEPVGIYVTINRTDGSFVTTKQGKQRPNRSKECIKYARAVFVEFDAKHTPPDDAALDAVPRSMVVRSKNGPHVYWLLHETEDLALWDRVVDAMIRKFNSDKQCKDRNRVLRIPGFVHRKVPADPFLVELEMLESSRRYTLEDIVKGFELDLAPPRARPSYLPPTRYAQDQLDEREKRCRAYLDRVEPAVEGSGGWDHTKKVCAYGWDWGLEPHEYFPLLLEWNARCQPPWDPEVLHTRLTQIFNSRHSPAGNPFGWKLEHTTPEWEEGQRRKQAHQERLAHEDALWEHTIETAEESVSTPRNVRSFSSPMPADDVPIEDPPEADLAREVGFLPEPELHLAMHQQPDPSSLPNRRPKREVKPNGIILDDYSEEAVDEESDEIYHDDEGYHGWSPPTPDTGHSESSQDPNKYIDQEKTIFRGPDALPMTEHGNGQRFIRAFGGKVRYVKKWDTWLYWDSRRWRRDNDGDETDADPQAAGIVMEYTKCITRDMMALTKAVPDDKERNMWKSWCRSSDSMKGSTNMLKSASSMKGVAFPPGAFDKDADLLNTYNCIIDLRTGEMLNHARDYGITRLTKVSPADVDCPTWLAFLRRILDNDQDVIDFVQRAVGYSLTGETREQVLFTMWGTGRNGKTTFLNILRKLAGEYCKNTDFSSFEEKKTDQMRNDLARLNRARIVTAVEPNETRPLDEGIIKRITGDEPITARFLYGEFFDFFPNFKLLLSSNHKIKIRGTDEGVGRRGMMMPFNIRIPKTEIDTQLPEKLERELPGIMHWAWLGAQEWYQTGLRPPGAVLKANEEYRADMDALGEFLRRCTEPAEGHEVPSKQLFEVYRDWASEVGEKNVMSQRNFVQRLKDRADITWKRKMKGSFFLDLRLREGKAKPDD